MSESGFLGLRDYRDRLSESGFLGLRDYRDRLSESGFSGFKDLQDFRVLEFLVFLFYSSVVFGVATLILSWVHFRYSLRCLVIGELVAFLFVFSVLAVGWCGGRRG